MANNEYVNKVLFGDTIIMDISDTTAEEGDVIEGQTFYTKSGAPATGSLGDATTSTHGLMSVSDKIKLDNIDEIQVYETSDTSADVMSFSDGADDVPMALKVDVEPVQDLNGYDNPWPGGGGKNLLNTETSTGNKAINASGEIVTLSGSSYTELIDVSAGQYTFSYLPSGAGTWSNRIHGYDSNGDWVEQLGVSATQTRGVVASTTITVPSTVSKVRISYQTSNTSIQFESGSTATDYAPYSNICPISGWTGANVTQTGKNLVSGVDASAGTLGKIEGYKTSGSYKMNNIYTHLKAGKTYTISFDAMEGNETATGFIALYPLENGVVGDRMVSPYISGFVDDNGSDTLGANYKRIKAVLSPTMDINHILIGYYRAGKYCLYDPNTLMIEEGSVATDYESYSGNTYSITFPSSAGTVYGGTLTINRDGTGELVVDKGSVDLGTLNWSTSTDGVSFISDTAISGIKVPASAQTIADAICSNYKTYQSWDMINGTFGIASSGKVKVRDDSFGLNTANFKTAMDGVLVVYSFATPSAPISLTIPQVRSILGFNNIWADTGKINEIEYVHETAGLINTQDKIKLDSLSTVATSGDYDDLSNKPDLSEYITSVPTMTGATSSANGTAGLIPAPTTADAEKFFRGDGTWQDGGRPMVILSYGNSTWNDFIEAYNNNVIVYTRASSNSNPASGSQTRMAFMAYVNNAATPTEVEFQYYRSVSSHSATQQGDQVFVYKLTKTSGWSVTIRQASSKIVAGNNMSVTYSTDTLTVASTLESKTAAASGTDVSLVTTGEKAIWNNKADIADIPTATSDLTNDSGYLIMSDLINKADLDANGKVLSTQLPDSLDKNQGSENAGKFMKIGLDGILTPATIPSPDEKADKVINATLGNFAALDSSGNLTDSGKSASDFATKADGITNITRSGTTFTVTRADGTTFTFTQQDNNTTYSQISRGSGAGLAPGLPTGTGTTKYLREDGSWQVPPDNNTTYSAASGGGLSLSNNAFSLANSGATAGSYGPSANATPGYGATFNVPYITIDAKGRVTAASTKTVKIPASDNTNTWRGIQNNLTSTSTTDSLSAAQGKALNDNKQAKLSTVTFSATVASGQTAYDIAGRKYGNVCTLNVHVKTSGSSGWQTVATLASGYRPNMMTYACITDDTAYANNHNPVNQLRVTTDGNVQIYGTIANHTYYGAITYIC